MAPSPPRDLRPIVISGPSGVGKGTLCQRLFDAQPGTFATTVSHTTRKPRPREVEGETYFFVTPAMFSSLVSHNAFAEHAFFSGNHYGTSKQTIAEQTAKGLVVVLDIEMEGVKQMKANLEALEERLRSRSTENEEDIQKRLAQAKVEIEYAESGVHDMIIVNRDLEKAYSELREFVCRPIS